MNISRKNFLKSSAVVGAAAGFPAIIPSSVFGENAPSNRIAVGVIGCGDQAQAAWNYKNYDKSDIVAVCDPVKERRQTRGDEWGATHKYNDFRDLLANKDIDAIHIATPDHWHVPIALTAARAGKDMYVEKPLGLSIEQDLAAKQITTKYKRIFQYGCQQRSQQHLRMGIEVVLNGHIGDVKEIYVWAPSGSRGGTDEPELPVPDGWDYDLWLGPAPVAPFSNDRCLKKWPKAIHHCYDYAIGFIAGWGAHPVDQLQWWADKEGKGIPVEYKTTGHVPSEGILTAVSNWDMEAVYADGTKLYFMDTWTAHNSGKIPDLEKVKQFGNCTMFVGSKGWVAVSREGLLASTEEIRRKAKDPGPIKLPVSKNHGESFIDSVISREQPVATLESGIRSDIICHIGDIGARTGEILKWDPKKQTLIGSDAAKKMMHRPIRAPFDKLLT